MSNKKATKRALLTSILAICLCLVMLIGSTFAWFTDTASTSVNQIQSGTLDIQLLHTIEGKDVELKETDTLNWVAQDNRAQKDILWEPNCEYNLEQFKIKNAGNLAVKYKVILKATDISKTADGKTLLDVIDWTIKLGDKTLAVTSEQIKTDLGNGITIITDQPLMANTTETISITGHMKAEAGNDYQNFHIGAFGITVYATQYTEEYDSTTNQYDKMAEYSDGTSGGNTGDDPVVDPIDDAVAHPTDSEALADFLRRTTAAEVTIYLKENTTYVLPNISNKNVTFIGDDTNLIDMANSALTTGTNENLQLTFRNTTIQFSETDKQSIPGAGSVAYENCTIEGQYSMSGDQVRAADCIFKGSVVYTGTAAETTFNRCTFNVAEGAAVYVCSSATGENYTVTIEDCAFNNAGSATKSAVVIGSDSGSNNAYDVKINGCMANGFAAGDPTGSNLYNCSTDETVTVSVDDEQVYQQ